MSNIDFSQLVTARAKGVQAALAHKQAVKTRCKQRITAQFPIEAQQNIVQAIALHVLGARTDTAVHTGLSEAEIETALQAQAWIGAMQAACREVSGDLTVDPADEALWPDLPDGAAALIARF